MTENPLTNKNDIVKFTVGKIDMQYHCLNKWCNSLTS